MKSKIKNADTTLPIRTTIRMSDLYRAQSKVYPIEKGCGGPKLSSARFVKMAAFEKLLDLGFDEEFLKSIS